MCFHKCSLLDDCWINVGEKWKFEEINLIRLIIKKIGYFLQVQGKG